MANERHACAKETVRERTRATKAARASDMDSAFQGMTVLLRSPCQCTKKCYPCPFHTVTHVASRDSVAEPGDHNSPSTCKPWEGRRSEARHAPAPFQGFEAVNGRFPRVPLRSTRVPLRSTP